MTLFDDTPTVAQARTARVTCRVCERPAEVALDAPRLCAFCVEDLDRTAEHIASRLWMGANHLDTVWRQLDAGVRHADEVTLGRWNAFQDAVTAGDPRAAETERRVRVGGVAGAFADLVRRWLAWKDALEAQRYLELWAARAREEIEAARGA